MNTKLLIILCPPRSFSSVVSTMIGQHPESYCFPELPLFVAETVGEVLDREAMKGSNYSGPSGVLRALAQLHYGTQTTGTILKSGAWLVDRRNWSNKQLIDHLLESIEPRMGVKKSPVTCMKPAYIRRAYKYYPDAYYLHLTRHPIPTRKSMEEFFEKRKLVKAKKGKKSFGLDYFLIWYRLHRNIVQFTSQLPEGQVMRMKGEDLLSDPDLYLPQLAEWLGLTTDRYAINEMKHPENSPYAYVGPAPTRGGNDHKFMRNPALRSGQLQEPSLRDLFDVSHIEWITGSGKSRLLSETGLELVNDAHIKSEIRGMAQSFGYL